jgi:glutamate dehydrogenase
MTVGPDTSDLAHAYAQTYRGPHGGAEPSAAEAAETAAPAVVPALVAAQERLARRRRAGETIVEVYQSGDPDGIGPALQIVTDQAAMLMDSVTVLLHRLGVAYVALMHPTVLVRRDAGGTLLDVRPAARDTAGEGDGVLEETWIHIQLSPTVNQRALAEAVRLLPMVVADARQVAQDSAALSSTMLTLAHDLASDDGIRFPGLDRMDVSYLLRWLDSNYILLGSQRCTVSGGVAVADESSRLGVARLRDEVLPPLSKPGETVVLAQATMPSFLRYGAYPYIVAVREEGARGEAVEHRFVGLFTVAAMNANVLDIPLISRRVQEALAISRDDPRHPGQLVLDIMQTIPRSELFALSAGQLVDIADAVIDLGSRRRALLFLRSDPLGHFVSCLVYLPRDRYTTAVRLAMQDILVREFGGASIDYAARVSESPWAVVHFTVLLPDDPAPLDLTEATRTWGDRLLGSVQTGAIEAGIAEHYADALPEEYKQFVKPFEAIADIGIIEGLQPNSVRLQMEPGDEKTSAGEAYLTWYLAGVSASLSKLLPMLQCMGVEVLEERPFKVVRPDGLTVWIYQFMFRPETTVPHLAPDEWDDVTTRFTEAVTAIWDGRIEADRFNELVLRAGLTLQQVMLLRAYAKYLRQAGFPYSQSHIESVLLENTGIGGQGPGRQGRGACRGGRYRCVGQPGHRPGAAGLRLDDRGHPADELLRHRPGLGAGAKRTVRQAESGAHHRASTAAAQVRDLRLLPSCRGGASPVRPGGPRRPALVGPPRGFPDRGPGPGQSAGGQERRHRPGRRQGRVRGQTATGAHRGSGRRPRRLPRRRCRLLPVVRRRPAGPDRQRRSRQRPRRRPAGCGPPRR